MRSISLLVILLFVLQGCSGQNAVILESGNYISYYEDSSYYELIYQDSIIKIHFPKRHMFPSQEAEYRLYKKNDSLFELTNIKFQNEGFPSSEEAFMLTFKNKNLLVQSESSFKIENTEQPFYRKSYIDSLTDSDLMFSIHGSLKKRKELTDEDDKIFKNAKRSQVKLWKGKKAYDKYGAIGLFGVIEIKSK